MKFDAKKLLDTVETMNRELEDLRKKYEAKSKELFHSATKEFFETTPEIESIYWTQYTPFFNDGEECVFSRNDVYYTIASPVSSDDDEDEDYEDDDGEGIPFLSERYDSKNASSNLKKVQEMIKQHEFYPGSVTDIPYPFSYYCADETTDFQAPRDRRGSQPKKKVFNLSKAISYKHSLESLVKRIDEEDSLYPNKKQSLENFAAIKKFIEGIDESAIQDMFGDHVKVIVTKDGVDVQEYEHD